MKAITETTQLHLASNWLDDQKEIARNRIPTVYEWVSAKDPLFEEKAACQAETVRVSGSSPLRSSISSSSVRPSIPPIMHPPIYDGFTAERAKSLSDKIRQRRGVFSGSSNRFMTFSSF